MKRTAFLACLLLAGCTGQQTQDAMRKGFGHVFKPRHAIERFEALCANAPFPGYGRCIRSELVRDNPRWHADPHADLVDVYLAWLDAAGTHVADGRMEESDARLGAAEMKVRLKSIASERATNASIQQQAAMSRMLTGLAILNSATPQPGPVIQCRTTPTGLGTTMTTCH